MMNPTIHPRERQAQFDPCGCRLDATGDFILEPCPAHEKLVLDGYDEWADELEALPWWEAVDRAYEREVESRLAAYRDRLREEGDVA